MYRINDYIIWNEMNIVKCSNENETKLTKYRETGSYRYVPPFYVIEIVMAVQFDFISRYSFYLCIYLQYPASYQTLLSLHDTGFSRQTLTFTATWILCLYCLYTTFALSPHLLLQFCFCHIIFFEKIPDQFSKTYELLFEMICDSAAIFEHKICHRIPSEKYAIFLIVS